ncbi:8392_t:CDS:2 [Gigaspora rosea]|nr:8392_t:CDS:2 [Gigaspora rosea]
MESNLNKTIPPLNFLGAFPELFEAKFRVNISTVDNVKVWLDEFSNLHKSPGKA